MPSTRVQASLVELDDAGLTVSLPRELKRDWALSEHVAIESEQEIEPGKQLQILVEKDFQCVHSRAEEDPDTFPNPR